MTGGKSIVLISEDKPSSTLYSIYTHTSFLINSIFMYKFLFFWIVKEIFFLFASTFPPCFIFKKIITVSTCKEMHLLVAGWQNWKRERTLQYNHSLYSIHTRFSYCRRKWKYCASENRIHKEMTEYCKVKKAWKRKQTIRNGRSSFLESWPFLQNKIWLDRPFVLHHLYSASVMVALLFYFSKKRRTYE